MTAEKFEAQILGGHKDAAVEVPFDPARRWGAAPTALWAGRRGHRVRGTLNGVAFESAVVPRSKRWWMLVDANVMKKAQASEGTRVRISLQPLAAETGSTVSRARSKSSKKKTGTRSKRSPRKS